MGAGEGHAAAHHSGQRAQEQQFGATLKFVAPHLYNHQKGAPRVRLFSLRG